MQRKSRGLLAVAVSLIPSAALAQASATPPAGTGTPPAQGMPTSGMPMGPMQGASGGMPMMGMMQSSMAGHIEGRIAFLKAELKITDAQQPLWNAVADAMRATAKEMAGMPNCMSMMQSIMRSSGTLPEILAAHEKAMAADLEVMRKLTAAVEPLYAALSDDQKKTADQLMVGPMGIMGMGMM